VIITVRCPSCVDLKFILLLFSSSSSFRGILRICVLVAIWAE
jgi:hypothetical protein